MHHNMQTVTTESFGQCCPVGQDKEHPSLPSLLKVFTLFFLLSTVSWNFLWTVL